MHLDLEEYELRWLDSDERYGRRIGKYTIIGMIPPGKGETKMYIIQCDVCAKDPYLFGLGIFTASYYAINNNNPCGCGEGFKCPEELQYKKIKRICENSGFKFKGFSGDYKGTATKCLIECLDHGDSRSCTVKEIIAYNRPTCKGCFSERMREVSAGTDEECINKFRGSGGFHEDTVFYRSDRLTNEGQKQFWYMLCGECGATGESYTNSLTQGCRSCDCAPGRQKQAYINLIYNQDEVPIAIKFGIANNSSTRIDNQNIRNSLLSRQFEVYEFQTKSDCLAAEREVKSTLDCKFLTKDVFPDGYTETTNVKFLVDILKIYKKHGGVSIMYIANDTYSDGCVACVESKLFEINHAETSSSYFRTKHIMRETYETII